MSCHLFIATSHLSPLLRQLEAELLRFWNLNGKSLDTHLISMTSLSLPIFLESDSKRSKESFAEGKRYEVTITLVNRLVYYTRGVLCAVPWRHQDLASPARLPHLCLLLSVDHLAKKGFISTCGDCDAYKHTGPSGQSFSCCIIVSWSQFYDMTTI